MRKKLCSAAVCCLVLFLTACGLASQASVAALVERDVQALEALAGEIALAGAAGDAEYPGVDHADCATSLNVPRYSGVRFRAPTTIFANCARVRFAAGSKVVFVMPLRTP